MNEILQNWIEEAARHYLLHEHKSPLNEILHQCDLKTEMQYHRDIEQAYIEGGKNSLQNQWISVEEALPTERDKEDEQYSTNVFARTKDCIRYAYYDFYNESWCSVEGGYRFGGDVTHWMPIPSLEGGEK